MKKEMLKGIICLAILTILLQGCIHDYPKPVKGSHIKGEDPTILSAQIEVSFDLKWENMIHNVEISPATKARNEQPHRFIIEIVKEEETVCRDIKYLSANEFSLGKLSHKLTANLEADRYKVAVWYDFQDEEGNFPFEAENLQEVRIKNFSTTDAQALQCGYASDLLDLSDIKQSDKEITVTKEMELQHPGARFEIVTTDIQEFITNHHEAMMQGDYYTVSLFFSNSTPIGFDLHSGSLHFGYEQNLQLSGLMRLPFADYDELKIAEGFLFCTEENDVTLKLSVKNSALVTEIQTEYFSFPIKPGCITTVYGDFLSSPIDGVFSINNIWDGEIVIEI